MQDVLTIENLKVHLQQGQQSKSILKGIDLSIPHGKTVALVGESGSGKSTLGLAIMGLLPRHKMKVEGRILFRDPLRHGTESDLTATNEDAYRALRGNRLAMAFQEPSAALSQVESIGHMLLGTLLAHQPQSPRRAHQRVHEILRQTGFPDAESAYRRYPFELSGGLRQRAMLASALICKPALVVADEPTSALDVTVQALALKLLSDLRGELGLSLLFITHDFGVVANVADYVVVLKHGEVVEHGSVNSVLQAPHSKYAQDLLAAVPRLEGPVLELTSSHASNSAVQVLSQVWNQRLSPPRGTPLIDIRDVSKRFVSHKRGNIGESDVVDAVTGVSLTINAGECVGLVGESGCGKSTLSKLIMAVLSPDSGTVHAFDGHRLAPVESLRREELKRYRTRIQYVFQDPFASLNPRLTVEEIVSEGFAIHRLGTRQERRRWSEALLEMVELDAAMLSRHPSSFSGGQRQRIGIARALALGPDLLVCDEPVSALDVSVQAQVLGLLDGLRTDIGVASLFVSHNLAVVRAIAAKVCVMCRGRIVESAPTTALFSNPQHPYTRALLAANPEPNPERKLDLGALLNGRASEPEAWPPRFRLTRGQKPRYETVGEGHLVAIA